MKVELDINREKHTVEVEPRLSLLDCLRDKLLLTGAHAGCEHGVCGACTVLIDGRTARGCLTLAAQVSGRTVDTIEGMSDSGQLSELQNEFVARNAAQCGFCSSGMLLTAYELVASGAKLSRSEIREVMSGNMCRCTGYHAIIDAVEAVMTRGQA